MSTRPLSLLMSLALAMTLNAQETDYVLKKKTFSPSLTTLNFSPDGTILLAGTAEGSFLFLDPETLETLLEVKEAHGKAVMSIDMSPKMDRVLTAGGNGLRLWDRNGKPLETLNGHSTTIWNAEISADGRWAVSSAYNKTFLLWDLPGRSLHAHMRGHSGMTLATAFHPDSRRVASAGSDETILLWEVETGQVLLSLHGPPEEVYDLEFSPEGSVLAAASAGKSIRLYGTGEGELIRLLKGHRGRVRSLSFHPEGRFLVSAAEDQSVILWDVQTGDRIHTFHDESGPCLETEFYPDGNSFATLYRDGSLVRRSLDPGIFVWRYFADELASDMEADSLFLPRMKGESRKDFRQRQEKAERRKREWIRHYYGKLDWAE